MILRDLELEAVREVAPFYFCVGHVFHGDSLIFQVKTYQLDALCLRLDNVIIRCQDPLDLAYLIIADRKQILVFLFIPNLQLVILEAYQVLGATDVAQAARVLPLEISVDEQTLSRNLQNACVGS